MHATLALSGNRGPMLTEENQLPAQVAEEEAGVERKSPMPITYDIIGFQGEGRIRFRELRKDLME